MTSEHGMPTSHLLVSWLKTAPFSHFIIITDYGFLQRLLIHCLAYPLPHRASRQPT
ncbi:conserved hypothetical protein [Ricinus communis]|uniref:Uncharacterized protein n=1 Tax=Ricinus communis TaxID=3988 RepID=B9SF81_RICCO|nr:conserved hypothetical protein [Ricinus communis]